VDSLEVRWIAAGPVVTAMRDWFAPFPAGTEARDDAYLLLPRLAGLSVKLRDRVSLEVKSYLGSPGVLDLPHRCRGRLEYWRKSSFRCDPLDQSEVLPAGWSMVGKRRLRTWFPMAAGEDPAAFSAAAAQAGCAVELTQAQLRGEPWWSVGFEATGPAGLLRGALQHAADLMFAQPPPGVDFSLDTSRSYADWLTGQRSSDASQSTKNESLGQSGPGRRPPRRG
jgi:hypothetical protein